MFVGVIKTKDVLLHPRELIRMRGFKGYLKLVWRALHTRRYAFIGMTQGSDWIFDRKVQEDIKTEGVDSLGRASDPKLGNRAPHTSNTKSASK